MVSGRECPALAEGDKNTANVDVSIVYGDNGQFVLATSAGVAPAANAVAGVVATTHCARRGREFGGAVYSIHNRHCDAFIHTRLVFILFTADEKTKKKKAKRKKKHVFFLPQSRAPLKVERINE